MLVASYLINSPYVFFMFFWYGCGLGRSSGKIHVEECCLKYHIFALLT